MVAEMITKIGIPSDAELFLRVIVASVLGYMIGYERKNRDKSAGMRTHAIVALGAALMMVVSKYGFYDVEKVDSSRVAAQIVSGVGFLGAGVIFVRNGADDADNTADGGDFVADLDGAAHGSILLVLALLRQVDQDDHEHDDKDHRQEAQQHFSRGSCAGGGIQKLDHSKYTP